VAAPSPKPITQLLAAAGQGDDAARERLWAAIYDELHRVAQSLLRNDAPDRRLQPTTLVHEVYLRLVGDEEVHWPDRRHFFAAAANAMRHIRIDDVRRRGRRKRGGGRQPIHLDEGLASNAQRPCGGPPTEQDPDDLLALDEALEKLAQKDPHKAELVDLRYFAGLTLEECAAALEVSVRAVCKEWRIARAWLHRELTK
jgi:RNA polymerase sigma factor (TIGR02999 family)